MFGEFFAKARTAACLLVLFACVTMTAGSVGAAYLRIPLKASAERQEAAAASETKRKQLFEDFLQWLREHPLR